MINIPNCPKCGSYTAPDLIEVNILEEGTRNTYEEVYECRCGCRFVALHPRHIRPLDEGVKVHRIEHEEKNNGERQTEELKCPHCGSTEIEEDDCIDTEYISATTMARRYCGCCTKCEALLQWEEVFTFSNYQNVEVYG